MMLTNRYTFLNDPLNLPRGDFRITDSEGRLSIFDPLRKKFLILTPEEWVRQHVIHYLIHYRDYPRSLFSLEKGIKYNQIQKRFDILVLDRMGASFLLVECKAPEVKLSQQTAEQIAVYNKIVKARYIAISNGHQHICLATDSAGNYVQIREFPFFG